MEFSEIKLILIRLYKDYVKRYLKKIFLSLVLSIIVAGCTAAIAWLLDPAVKKILLKKYYTILGYTRSYSAGFWWQRFISLYRKIKHY